MVEKTSFENEPEQTNVPSKLHTCPLDNWCDQCAYCEFSYDELKIKAEEKDFQELILNKKIESVQSRLNGRDKNFILHSFYY